MPASAALDSGDSVSPSAAERSRLRLARRDCSALGVFLGGQEVRRSGQAVELAWHRVERSRQGGMAAWGRDRPA